MPAAVTPSGVRDGDPAALAGLCAVRGPSVLAYCRHVAGAADAGDGAAEAFASFRAAVIETTDLANLNPEALLISATRRAAASRAARAPLGVCAVVPLLLAARVDKTISAGERELLEQHLQTCWACRAPVARFEAAERAYRDPPDPLMDPAIIVAVIAAMAAVAPTGGAAARALPTNGAGAVDAAEEADVVAQPTTATAPAQPTTELQTTGEFEPDLAAAPAAASSSAIGPARARGRRAPRRTIGSHIPRVRRPPSAPPATVLPASVLALDGAGSPSRGARRSPSGKALPLPIVLPIAVVLLALLVALFAAGVFGGDDPASSSRIDVPAEVPAQNRPADVVVVPGAKQARPDDVESAKARERARAKRRREAAAVRAGVTTTPATTRPAPAAPAAPPAPVVVPPPAPPPSPAADNADEGSRKADAGSGATGGERIPPAEDTSTVPELAPAPGPAAP